jgi:NTP pyrophosphatase (non-canonical NTP hydrolase)
MPLDLATLQQAVGEWGLERFPHSTPETILAHLGEETGELVEALATGDEGAVIKEAVDVLLLTLHLCHRRGVSFSEARARTREVDPEKGYARHVEAPLPSAAAAPWSPLPGADGAFVRGDFVPTPAMQAAEDDARRAEDGLRERLARRAGG